MREKFSIVSVAIAAAVVSVSITQTPAQGPAPSAAPPALKTQTLKTPWGDPDLQGIWTSDSDIPLQRPARYANQEFFTPQQQAELDKARTEVLARADASRDRGDARDVAGAYNSQFVTFKRTGARTSLIVDPPDGRVPPLTPEALKAAAADREFRLALLQATDTCKDKKPNCNGGKYDPTPSPMYNATAPRYNVIAINRHDGPEDGNLANRCLTPGLPEFGNRTGSYRRIVQTPGGITIFYDVGQGQGWQRNIIMDGRPHLPASIRQWYGDSRGRWEGNTLVVDVTNFSHKTEFEGSRENLHLVERFTRTGPDTIAYEVRIEDPTVWTQAWTVKQEFTSQSNEENRFYTEPRCVEGNVGLPGLLRGRRVEDYLFENAKGIDPRTVDNVAGGFLLQDDPLR
jgi:hypothetical protein